MIGTSVMKELSLLLAIRFYIFLTFKSFAFFAANFGKLEQEKLLKLP